jgi:hypothetical protein
MTWEPAKPKGAGTYNTDPQLWNDAAKRFRALMDGGPTFRVLEGHAWGIPGGTGGIAQFETSEQASRVLREAGFRFIEAEKGFRA